MEYFQKAVVWGYLLSWKGGDSVNVEAALIRVAYNFKRLTKVKKVSEIVKLLIA